MGIEYSVCIVSQRKAKQLVARCTNYEFEDIIEECSDADIVKLEPYKWLPVTQRLLNRSTLYISSFLRHFNPGYQKFKLKKTYDILFYYCMIPRDVFSINSIKNWKKSCHCSIIYFDEIWISQINNNRSAIKIMSEFDFIFSGCNASCDIINKLTNKPCYYLPPAVNIFSFIPWPVSTKRVIDVFSIGRRNEQHHEELLQLSDKGEIFYLYDTVYSGNLHTKDYKAHRNLISSLIKKSKYFMVDIPKFDLIQETNKQCEIGYRYFEGSAGGSLMLGRKPEGSKFEEFFGWDNSVLEVDQKTGGITSLVKELNKNEDFVTKQRKKSILNSIERNDWAYRWENILESAGLSVNKKVLERKSRLMQARKAIDKNF